MDAAILQQIQPLLIDPARLLWGSWAWDVAESEQPLGFIDLQSCAQDVRLQALPPVPLIGLGDRSHPLAASLDAVLEPPISAEALIRQVTQAPKAAAVVVQLLRSLDGIPTDRALTLESVTYGLLQGSAEYHRWLLSRTPAGSPLAMGRVLLDRRDAEMWITLDRPWARNAIDRTMRDQLFEAFSLAVIDSEVRSIKLRAIGSAFSIGGDLEEFGTTRDPATAHTIRSRTLPALPVAARAEILDVHVQGACVGAGLEISAFARRVTATSDAWFQLPELSMGLIPGAGGCVSVPRRIGRQRAALMILSGRRMRAVDALRWGLIDAIED